MTDDFIKNARSWGKVGEAWLKDIPKLIAKYEKEWNIIALPPYELNYNYVAPAKMADGSQTVLKIGFPQDRDFQSEIKALELFNGDAICKLLKQNNQDAIILIEKVSPGKPVSSIGDDGKATRIIAQTMKKLHKPLPVGHTFATPKKLVTAFPKYLEKHSNNEPLPILLVKKAIGMSDKLISTSASPVLVHGDLHHFNVLSSDTHGWRAIDPKGIAAELLYDVGAMIRNPYEDLKSIQDLKPLIASRIKILSDELDADARRITEWCFVQTMLSSVWSAEGVKGPSHASRAALALNDLVDTYTQS